MSKNQVNRANLVAAFNYITEIEIQDKRVKGLCFCCDENYSPRHCCKGSTLQVLIVSCEEENVGEIEEGAIEEEHSHSTTVTEIPH